MMGFRIDPATIAEWERKGLIAPQSTPASTPTPTISERAFQAEVIKQAKRFGWRLIYHTHDSRKSTAGFPDLVMIRGRRLIWIELKVGDNKLSAPQYDWRDGLIEAGQEWHEWRPEMWPEILEILT